VKHKYREGFGLGFFVFGGLGVYPFGTGFYNSFGLLLCHSLVRSVQYSMQFNSESCRLRINIEAGFKPGMATTPFNCHSVPTPSDRSGANKEL